MSLIGACDLIGLDGQLGHQCSQAPGRPNLHLVSFSRRPRWAIGASYANSMTTRPEACSPRISGREPVHSQAIRAGLLESAIANTLWGHRPESQDEFGIPAREPDRAAILHLFKSVGTHAGYGVVRARFINGGRHSASLCRPPMQDDTGYHPKRSITFRVSRRTSPSSASSTTSRSITSYATCTLTITPCFAITSPTPGSLAISALGKAGTGTALCAFTSTALTAAIASKAFRARTGTTTHRAVSGDAARARTSPACWRAAASDAARRITRCGGLCEDGRVPQYCRSDCA
jgi:hypothetical protein